MASIADKPYPSSTDPLSRQSGSTGSSSISGDDTLPSLDTLPDSSTGSRLSTPEQGDMLSRVVQGAHATIDRLAESAAPHVQRLQGNVTAAGDTLHSQADHLREVGDEWAEGLRSTVRENPLAAVATALALGMLVARLTR